MRSQICQYVLYGGGEWKRKGLLFMRPSLCSGSTAIAMEVHETFE